MDKKYLGGKKSQFPPGKIPKFHFLAKTIPPQAKKIRFPPPSQIISEIFIPPQKFGVKLYYGMYKCSVDVIFLRT